MSGVSVRKGYVQNVYCFVKVLIIKDHLFNIPLLLCHVPNQVPTVV